MPFSTVSRCEGTVVTIKHFCLVTVTIMTNFIHNEISLTKTSRTGIDIAK